MSRFTDFTDAVADAGPSQVVLDWRHRLIAPDGTIAASTDPGDTDQVWGAELQPLAFDRKGFSASLATLTVPVDDLDLVPDRGGPLHPDSGYRVTVEAGLVTSGVTSWELQATMLPHRVIGEDTGTVAMRVELVDTARPARSNMVNPFLFDAGETVSAVVRRLLGQVISDAQVADTPFAVPSGSIGQGEPRDRYLTELLVGVGHELTTTREGLVITQPIPSAADDPNVETWRYGQPDGIPIDRARRIWETRTPQGWRIEGGSFQSPDPPITLTVYDTDPTSEGFFDGSLAAQLGTTRAQWVTSLAQAAEAGYGQLRLNGVGPMIVEFWSIPNPFLQRGDIIELERPALNADGRFRVLDYTLPIQVDGMMRVVCRKVYNPAQGFVLPAETPDGCRTSYAAAFSDTSEFPGRNLEAVPVGEGSPHWTEHEWSWGIEEVNGQARAMQRYRDGWSMATLTFPLCAVDQSMSMTDVQVPSGRRVGPVVRSSGGFDGYAFLTDDSGRLTIERWLNGRHQATLASGNAGGSINGQTMTITATGTTITGTVGATTISAVDDAAGGSYVGMLGWGGAAPNGPSCASVTAAPA